MKVFGTEIYCTKEDVFLVVLFTLLGMLVGWFVSLRYCALFAVGILVLTLWHLFQSSKNSEHLKGAVYLITAAIAMLVVAYFRSW